MAKRILLFLFLVFLLIPGGYAQYFSTGQDPASIKWKQIKTEKFRLIFPDIFEKRSQYLANILTIVTENEPKTMPARVPRIPVVLHPFSSVSNGFTVWAPRRIELYTTPPQSNYPEEWLEQLVIHEYRHAVQTSRINRGFSRVLSWITGEQGTGAILGLFVPAWFLEGDAVAAETGLTNSGRGRVSSFENILRAQLLEKGAYSYDKAVLGSYRDFVPDQYALGYPLVAQGRKLYGTQLWNTALDRVGKIPFMVVPFSSGIRKVTGMHKVRFYKEMISDLTRDWKNQMEKNHYSVFSPVTHKDQKKFTSYIHPIFLNDSLIIAERENLDNPDQFVLINRKTGKEKTILTLGSASDESISVSGEKLIWTEFSPHERWQNRNFSVIRYYDFKTKKAGYLTKKSRYFAPFFSPDARRIAAVKTDEANNPSIDILEAQTGSVLQHIPMNEYLQVMTPNWSPDGTFLVFVVLTEKGKSLATMDLQTQKVTHLLPFTFVEISGPAYYFDHKIIFSGDYSGIQNLYAIDTLTKNIFQIISSRFGALDPDLSADRKTMLYSDYTANGYRISETKTDSLKWIPLEKIEDHSIRLYDSIVQQENMNLQDTIIRRKLHKLYLQDKYDLDRDTISGKIFPSVNYSRLLNLFNPHSWAPLSLDVNNLNVRPGISVLSQNVLSTMTASAGWEYDRNEMTGKLFTNLSYQGWYPVFDFNFSIGKRAAYRIHRPSGERFRFTWQETNLQLSVSIPWNFTRGRYFRSLTPSVGGTLINLQHNPTTPDQLTSGNILSLDYSVRFSQYLRSSVKDLYPRWGQVLDLRYRNTPFPGNDMGEIFAAQTYLYFPGIFRHHGILAYGGYQAKPEETQVFYTFSDMINYPRGYAGIGNDEAYSIGVNYKFPLFYPDFSAGSVGYFKRFSLALFFDWAQDRTGNRVDVYQSAGAEITSDLHLLRFLFPFELGVRTIYFPFTNSWGWEFLYAISY
jgi:Tol biopolymer transport system component